MEIIEIRVRRFFTCDEADIAPSSTVLVTPRGDAEPDWADLMRKLCENTKAQLADGPFTNLREMTMEEVELSRTDEPVSAAN